MNKVILIDKPVGWTSFDVVAKVRSLASAHEGKRVKVGHAGTLDPFATGLLIVLVGEATKNQDQYLKQDKEYLATIRLGETSTTGDPEGEITKKEIKKIPTPGNIKEVLQNYTGAISQVPPAHSAIKINGKRAYLLARAGKEVTLEPRNVNINEIKLISYHYPILEIRVSCSSGTYIRSLARDIGGSLKCGGFLTALRRTKIGNYSLEDALLIDTVTFV